MADKISKEVRARLVAEYEARLDEALAALGSDGEVTLEQIENRAAQLGREIAQQLNQTVLEADSGQSAVGPSCPQCKHEMSYKGLKPRYLRTRNGEVCVKRAYYYCADCRCGLFPPG